MGRWYDKVLLDVSYLIDMLMVHKIFNYNFDMSYTLKTALRKQMRKMLSNLPIETVSQESKPARCLLIATQILYFISLYR